MAFLALILFPVLQLLSAFPTLLGLILVKWQANKGAFVLRQSDFYPYWVMSWKAPWMWIWGNEENGIDGLTPTPTQEWWNTQTGALTPAERIYEWSGLRNTVNNLRFVPPFGFKINPAKVKYIGTANSENAKGWFVCWHGVYASWHYLSPKWSISIGWRVQPCDAIKIFDGDTRAGWASMCFSLKRI
jgi:hypothetical protein